MLIKPLAAAVDITLYAVAGLGLQAVVLLSLLVLLVPRSRHLTYLSRDGYNKWEDPYSTYSDSSFLFGRAKAWLQFNHSVVKGERGHAKGVKPMSLP